MLRVEDLPPITDLLPHDPPMVLLDAVRDFTDTTIDCRVVIRDEAPFVEDGKVAALVSLEYMAQAAGVLLGVAAYSESGAIKRGLLLGCRELRLEVGHFAVGDELGIHAKHVWGSEGMANFECTVTRGDEQVAWATLNVLVIEPDGARVR